MPIARYESQGMAAETVDLGLLTEVLNHICRWTASLLRSKRTVYVILVAPTRFARRLFAGDRAFLQCGHATALARQLPRLDL